MATKVSTGGDLRGWSRRLQRIFHRMTLFRRLLLVGLTMTVIVVGLALYTGYLATRSLEQRIVKDRLVATEAAATSLERMTRHVGDNLRVVADAVSEEVPASEISGRLTRGLIARVISDDEAFAGVIVMSADGTELLRVGGPGGPLPVDIPRLPLPQEPLVGNVPLYLPAFRGAEDGATYIPVAVPMALQQGGLKGYVVGVLSIQRSGIPGYLATIISVLDTGHADLLEADGRVIASTETDHLLTTGDHPQFYAEMRGTTIPTVRTVAYAEEEKTSGEPEEEEGDHVMAYVSLTSAPWALSVGGSEEETFGPVRTFRTRMYLLAGFVLGFTIIGGTVGTAKLVRPVRALSLEARRLATGDLSGQIAIKEGGEIGDLAQDMETMRVRLKGSLGEIQDLNADLERRIAQRTEELQQRNRELEAASTIAGKVASSIDLDQVLQQTLESVAEATGQQSLAIFLMDKEGKRLTLTAGLGLRQPFHHLETSVVMGQCLCGQVALAGQAQGVSEVMGNPLLTRTACAVAGYRCVVSYPLRSRDRIEGVLTVFSSEPNSLSQNDYPVVDLICHQVGVAIQNARLYQEAQEKETTTHLLLGKVINAQEEERRRLARELHDETGQTLTAISLSLETLRAELSAEQESGTRKRLDDLREMTRAALTELRKMAMALRPSALDDLGLVPAVRRYAMQHLESQGIRMKLEAGDIDHALDSAHQTVLFRIVQEAINNVARHSKATSASIRFWREGEEVCGEVSDNGVGFEPEQSLAKHASSAGLGLLGMQERAALVGGSVVITSRPGRGSKVVVRVPASKGGEHGNGRKG